MGTFPSEIAPAATEEEAAAIVAAVDALWPQPTATAPAPPTDTVPKWRFSGRWWSRPVASRRVRPW